VTVRSHILGLVGTFASVSILTACTANADTPASAPAAQTEITVGAAASLTGVLPEIAQSFSAENPDITVRFTFAGSNAIVEQVRGGAPIDVVATASASLMDTAVSEGLAGDPTVFARNSMIIAMPPGNPAGVQSLQDLARSNVKVAVCAAQAPCGSATAELLAKNGVSVSPVTQELDVRDVLGKVLSDEVDAGIVYVTDARSAGRQVASIAIPASSNVTTTYPIAVVKESRHLAAAQTFVEYVASPAGQETLRAWGFATP
jgi:molybdate transport system substrate-binding protein